MVHGAKAWCESIGANYFRLQPQLSYNMKLDEIDNKNLIGIPGFDFLGSGGLFPVLLDTIYKLCFISCNFRVPVGCAMLHLQ